MHSVLSTGRPESESERVRYIPLPLPQAEPSRFPGKVLLLLTCPRVEFRPRRQRYCNVQMRPSAIYGRLLPHSPSSLAQGPAGEAKAQHTLCAGR